MIIGEIGLNHLGKEEYASQYIDTMVKTSIDAVTFQIREKEYYKRNPKPLIGRMRA